MVHRQPGNLGVQIASHQVEKDDRLLITYKIHVGYFSNFACMVFGSMFTIVVLESMSQARS